ncbi:MAG: tetratricopeptide repeat protein [Armatimonadota bacterium]
MENVSASPREEGARQLQAGNLPEAERLLSEAVRLDPGDARAYGLLGICQARQGNLPAALVALRQASALQPGDAAAHYNLALAAFQAGDTREAASAVRRALQLQPEHAGAQDLLRRIEASGAASTVAPPAAAPAAPNAAPAPPLLGGPAQTWQPAPAAGPAPGAPMTLPTGTPHAAAVPAGKLPGIGRRFLRGWGWGLLYGQWWTLWSTISMFLFSRGSVPSDWWVETIGQAIIYGFFGAITGWIIGLANLDEEKGWMVGVGAGLIILGLEMLLGGGFMAINIFFYVFTGRYIGAGIASRVQRPV